MRTGNNYSGARWAFSTRSNLRAANFGDYRLEPGQNLGIIRRQDPDHSRTVAFITDQAEWRRFVAALKRGADEVAAVHAIDAT